MREKKATRKTTLENGIRVITKKMPHVRSVSMGIWVNVGARDEAEASQGACHFIEHMIFKGTATRSAYQIAAEMDAIGGHINAFTAMEHTCYHGKVLDSRTERLCGILSDIFLHSTFDAEEIRREKDVVLQEIHLLEDTPEDYLHLLAGDAFFGSHPLGRSILGTPKTLARFDTAALMDHFQHWYRPERILIAATGNVDHERFVDLVAPAFGAIEPGGPDGEREAPRTLAGDRVLERDLEQAHLILGAPGLSNSDPDRYAYYVMNVILGGNMSSRLFQEIRERRGLAYAVYSFTSSYMDSGMLGIYAAVEPRKVEETLRLVTAETARLASEPPGEEELACAKDFIKGSIFLSAESTDSQMLRLTQNEVLFGRDVPLSEVAERIDRVTPEMVRDMAGRLFQPDGLALALLGPVKRGRNYRALLAA